MLESKQYARWQIKVIQMKKKSPHFQSSLQMTESIIILLLLNKNQFFHSSQMLGTLTLKAPAFKLAQSNAKTNPSNTYLYSFDYGGEYTR